MEGEKQQVTGFVRWEKVRKTGWKGSDLGNYLLERWEGERTDAGKEIKNSLG